jgi:hypothetical protein
MNPSASVSGTEGFLGSGGFRKKWNIAATAAAIWNRNALLRQTQIKL